MAADPVTMSYGVTDVQTTPPPGNSTPLPGEPAREEVSTGVQFGPEGPSVDVFRKSGEPDTEPSVFDIELPETAPVIRIRIGGEKIDVSFWTLFDLCTKYEQEFVNLPWETFAPIVAATLGVKELDLIQWRVLVTNVEHLMSTKLKKNFQIINRANDLQGKNPATSSDSPKP